MRYLGLALFAEGPTDHSFLRPLLARLCAQVCAEAAEEPVEISELIELHSPSRLREESREVRVLEAARESFGTWNVLFIHTDAGGDAEVARRERVEPAAVQIQAQLAADGTRTVAVVPVRETEAWTVADGEALRAAFGTRKTNDQLGIPTQPRDVEGLLDPKKALTSALILARGARAARRERVAGKLALIGERANLDVLALVPAFARLREELVATLKTLRYLPGD